MSLDIMTTSRSCRWRTVQTMHEQYRALCDKEHASLALNSSVCGMIGAGFRYSHFWRLHSYQSSVVLNSLF
eukprot:4271216-Pleurochrysis_carterae.AAC.1